MRRKTLSLVSLTVGSILLSLPAFSQVTINSHGSGTEFHGVPPSVTSFGFGGQPGFHGVPASVTSPNFGRSPIHVTQPPVFFQHRRHPLLRNPFFGNVVAVPYAYPAYVMDPGVDSSLVEDDDDYRGGPTIFDRRGPGTEDYRRPQVSAPRQSRNEDREGPEDYRARRDPTPSEVSEQTPTMLVFKDGHQLEVRNYAIVGSTLFDLSDGRTRKVGLSELDLSATVKENGDRGVDFQVPAAARLN